MTRDHDSSGAGSRDSSRREFLKFSGGLAAGAALAGESNLLPWADPFGDAHVQGTLAGGNLALRRQFGDRQRDGARGTLTLSSRSTKQPKSASRLTQVT